MDLTENSPEHITPANYPLALTKLTEHVMTATQQLATLYQQENLALIPEDFIYYYCRWLGFIVNEKIAGNKTYLLKLITDTIQEHNEQGSQLCQMVNASTEQNTTQINELVNSHGLIVVPLLKLIQFISSLIKKTLSAKPKLRSYDSKKHLQIERSLKSALQEIFEQTFQTTVLEINALQIPNPLIFLLEHFSIMLGWLAGFFAQLSNKPVMIFLEKSFEHLNGTLQPTEEVNKLH